jgi:hypothetical protein
MTERTRMLIGWVLLPLLAVGGFALLIGARAVGGATLLPALLGSTGLIVLIATTITGAAVFGLSAARA